MHRIAWVFFLLFLSLPAAAGKGEELSRLQDALHALTQEQQAVYQQFQMVQELRRANTFALSYGQGGPLQSTGDVANYDDVAQARRNMLRRDEALGQEADGLYDRYSEIEARKKPLLEEIHRLTISR